MSNHRGLFVGEGQKVSYADKVTEDRWYEFSPFFRRMPLVLPQPQLTKLDVFVAKRKSVLLVGTIIVLLTAGAGLFLIQREFGGHHNAFSKTYFGRLATLNDLVINSADGTSVDLGGKWAIVSINSIPVNPAAVWLEKPDIARASFEVRDGEVILSGYTGCNGFGGTAHVLNGQLQTPEIVQTARLCHGNGLLQQETSLVRVLSSPGIWATSQTKSSSVVIVGTENIGFVQLRKFYE